MKRYREIRPARHPTYARLRIAVEELARAASIRERLMGARRTLAPLRSNEFEDGELRHKFDAIIDDLIGKDTSDRGEHDVLGGNFSVYALADQTVRQPDLKRARALALFARAMGAPSA